jgi:C4-type Zn-finger protein
MGTNIIKEFPSLQMDTLTIQNNPFNTDKILMGSRVCDNCGKTKDVSGGKSCSKGHFICHSCSSSHIHCPLCGHTLR